MGNLLQNNCNIIAEHFLDKYLNHLQDSLQKAEQIYRPAPLFYDDTIDSLDSSPQ